MHHYQFNIGDYKKDTAHLSILEHGIYRMLLDSYYTNEGPLEADDAKLMRTHCVRSADEQQAYKNVIEDFFFVVDGYYQHEGCDKVLAKIYEKSDKARESAAKRWANKNKDLKKAKCAKDANAMRTHSEGNANGMLPITHNPIPNNMADAKNASSQEQEFNLTWEQYPKRSGSNPKEKAFTQWKLRLKEGCDSREIFKGVRAYRKHCESENMVGTGFVMQAARFFGKDKEFETDWTAKNSNDNAGSEHFI